VKSTKVSILACLVAALALSAASGCHREGSAQKAAREADRALAKAGDRFDDHVDKRRK
jgi:hypothetical protein